MNRVAIVSPLRTPIGRFLGALAPLRAEDLASHIIAQVVTRSGVDPAAIDDVVLAQSYANSEAPCIGRWAALAAGLPIAGPVIQLDRRCGGGLQAIATAAMMVQSGAADIVIAGGVESMSNIEYYSTSMRSGARAGTVPFYDRIDRGRERSQPVERFGVISGMIETAENLARDYAITREAADALAATSQQRAADAWATGRFDEEVVAVPVPGRKGDPVMVARDEGIRAETTVESLAALRPLMKGGTVTAGNSSQQNDAAAACLVVSETALARHGLEPIAWFRGWAAAGCDPARVGIGPVPAVARLFARTGIGWDDLDLIELNEAFAVQVLAVMKGWGFDDISRINVNGSGISLGHPIGATGVRIMTSMLHELRRRKGQDGAGDDVHWRRPGHRRLVRSRMMDLALDLLRPGRTIYLPGASGESAVLADALASDPGRLDGVHVVSCPFPGINQHDYAGLSDTATATVFLPSVALQRSARAGRTRVLPIAYSQIAEYLRDHAAIDVAFAHVSPPGPNGFCSLGIAADFNVLAWKSARQRVLLINPAMPVMRQGPWLTLDDADIVVDAPGPIVTVDPAPVDTIAGSIGERIAALVPEAATVQIGLGNAPGAVWRHLAGHRDLVLASGLVAHGFMQLVEAGAMREDAGHRAGVVLGGSELIGFLAETDIVRMAEVTETHDADRIAELSGFTAINGAIEVDLFGQINLEWQGGKLVSGVGGAPDFARGARRSKEDDSSLRFPRQRAGTPFRGSSRVFHARLRWPAAMPTRSSRSTASPNYVTNRHARRGAHRDRGAATPCEPGIRMGGNAKAYVG